jgi:L-ribulose-5-phosphate 3-epimerase
MAMRIGVCSWSLEPAGSADLAQKVRAVGCTAVQLALDPLRVGDWKVEETIDALQEMGIEIRSGMMMMRGEDYATLETIRRTGGVRVDRHWRANLKAAEQNAGLAARLGITLVTFHAGFLPHDVEDPLRNRMLSRLRELVDRFAEHDVEVALETGQESAETLLAVFEDLDREDVGVNFDPANMILYGMGEPVASLGMLAGHVRQIHIKDAVATDVPGTWGREVAVGSGEVDWPAFFATTRKYGITCDLMIEREAGTDRPADIRRAREIVESLIENDRGARQ